MDIHISTFGEGFPTSRIRADIGLLARMGAKMNFESTGTHETLTTFRTNIRTNCMRKLVVTVHWYVCESGLLDDHES